VVYDKANVADAPALRSQEGIMARTDFPLSMDCRRLLVLAAAVPAARIVPSVNLGDAAAPRLRSIPHTDAYGPAGVFLRRNGILLTTPSVLAAY
jgi:hypothetical protein